MRLGTSAVVRCGAPGRRLAWGVESFEATGHRGPAAGQERPLGTVGAGGVVKTLGGWLVLARSRRGAAFLV